MLACSDGWFSDGTVGWKVKLSLSCFPWGRERGSIASCLLVRPHGMGVSKEPASELGRQTGSGQAPSAPAGPPQTSPSPPLLPRVLP